MQRPPVLTKSVVGPDRAPSRFFAYVAVGFMWMVVWRFQEIWPIIGKLQISLLLEFLLACALLSEIPNAWRWRGTKSAIFAMPFVLLGIMIIGLPTNLYPGQGFTFILKDFLPTLLVMTAIVVGFSRRSDLNRLGFAHLFGAAVYAAWVFLFIPFRPGGRLGELAFYDANDFACIIVCTIPFAVYFARPRAPTWKRVFAVAVLGLFVEMLIRSGSRGGFLGFLGVSAYIALKFHAIPKRVRIGAISLAGVLLVVLASANFWTMMQTIVQPGDDYNLTSPTGRKAVWTRGIGYMLENPVLGVGARGFERAEGMFSDLARERSEQGQGLKWSTAHNSFILVGAELGFGGLIAFTAMLVLALRDLSRIRPSSAYRPSADDVAFSQTLIASLIGFCISGFFISGSYFTYLYVLIGMAVAQIAAIRFGYAPARARSMPTPVARAPRWMRPTWVPRA